MKNIRIWEIDFLRGLAVIGMMIFHIYYVLNYKGLMALDLYSGAWNFLGNTIRNIFFLLVGVGMVLSLQRHQYKRIPIKTYYLRQIRKALLLLFIGGVITLASYLFVPESFVRYGVFSFLGTGVLLILPFISRPWILMIIGVFVLSFTYVFRGHIYIDSTLGYMLGFYPYFISSIDFFGIFPWVSALALGAFMAHFLYKKTKRTYLFPQNCPKVLVPFVWIGKYALWVYVLHLPLIFLGICFFQIVA